MMLPLHKCEMHQQSIEYICILEKSNFQNRIMCELCLNKETQSAPLDIQTFQRMLIETEIMHYYQQTRIIGIGNINLKFTVDMINLKLAVQYISQFRFQKYYTTDEIQSIGGVLSKAIFYRWRHCILGVINEDSDEENLSSELVDQSLGHIINFYIRRIILEFVQSNFDESSLPSKLYVKFRFGAYLWQGILNQSIIAISIFSKILIFQRGLAGKFKIIQVLRLDSEAEDHKFNYNKTMLAVSQALQPIMIWKQNNMSIWKLEQVLDIQSVNSKVLTFNNDSSLLASGRKYEVRIYACNNNWQCNTINQGANLLCFNSDSTQIALGNSLCFTINIFQRISFNDWILLHSFECRFITNCTSLIFNRDSSILIAMQGFHIRLFNLKIWQQVVYECGDTVRIALMQEPECEKIILVSHVKQNVVAYEITKQQDSIWLQEYIELGQSNNQSNLIFSEVNQNQLYRYGMQ